QAALDNASALLGDYLLANPDISMQAVAATLQLGRKAYAYRRMVVAEDQQQAAAALKQNNPQYIQSSQVKAPLEKVVFMFPGGGAQHSNMGLGLYRSESVFRQNVDRCLQILKEVHQLDLQKVLYPAHAESEPITNPLHGITLLFTIEWATAQLWISKGIQPDQMIGHSLGEYVAACMAGVFTLEEALAMVATRGKLFLQLKEGAMLSIPLSEKEVLPYMEEELSFAAINKPDYCVVSGPVDAIDRIKAKLTKDEIHAPRLHIKVAAHSTMVEDILEDFGNFLKTINYQAPRIDLVSNLDGQLVEEHTMQSPEYWKRHLRQTVRFADGIETLLSEEKKIFLEVGPGQTLSTFTRQHPQRKEQHIVLASLRHPKENIADRSFFLKTMGQLWLQGLLLDWKQNFEHVQRIPLPTYPFERKRYWIEPKRARDVAQAALGNPLATVAPQNMTKISKENIPTMTRKDWLKKEVKEIFHQLSGLPVSQMNDFATFLELGFDSLFLTQSITKIKKAFGVKLNFRQLFDEAPNIDALAAFLDDKLPADAFHAELAKHNEVPHTGEHTAATGTSEPLTYTTSPPPITDATPTADPFSVPPIQAVGNLSGKVEQLIQHQLLLMQQQLQLLRGQQPSDNIAPSNTPPAEPTNFLAKAESQKEPEKEAAAPNKEKPKEFSSFGPWVPIAKKSRADLTEREKKYLDDLIHRYTSRTKGSQQLSQRQRKHMADPRSIVGFNRMWKDMIYQIAMTHSKGAKMWDVDGNEYIDFRSSFGVNLFGNAPDFIQEAIKAQVDKGFELGVLTPLAEQVCDLICELTGVERASLVNTGSEAVSAAVRAARTATGKDKIIVFEGDYHGIADELLVKGIHRGGNDVSLPVAPGIPTSLVEQVI
ncbi:MAG TPA: aminotransferase class III-fold pyridoxal phosphate-dependent enzyme, partial [Phaeodactylibacter sp.]|nr:aminotransferase class III-fold pyridoxal phosphate-dependent enzyme [Phaeodactylibacter sp.]